MAQRLRLSAQKINWTPQPIRPERLHFFDLPSISQVAQRNQSSINVAPAAASLEAIPSSSHETPIPPTQPSPEKKSLPEPILTYYRLRKALVSNQADPSPSSGAVDLTSLMASGKEKGKITTLVLSQKGEKRKRSSALSFPDKIPKFAKKRRVLQARSNRIGWVNTGLIRPWAMETPAPSSKPPVLPQKTSPKSDNLSDIPYNLRRRKFSFGDASLAVGSSFQSPPLAGPGNGKCKLSISLSSIEIEEDFLRITGEKPPQNPIKLPKKTQKQLDVSTSTY